VVLTVLLALVAPSWVLTQQMWILAVGFLLGLPHGAIDHLLPLRHHWVRGGPSGLLAVLIGYVALAALAYAGLRLAGPVVLPVLLAVSVLHFGSADLAADRTRPAATTSWSPGNAAEAVARGLPIVAGPLLSWPTLTGSALAGVGLGAIPPPAVTTVIAVVLLVVSAAYVVVALRSRRWTAAAEVVLLLALFTTAPPLAAFGVYFGPWHGLRHTARLIADDSADREDLDRGRLLRPLLRFGAAAALPAGVALVTVVVLVWFAAGHQDFVAPVFSVLLALTVPHVLVVARLDHDRPR